MSSGYSEIVRLEFTHPLAGNMTELIQKENNESNPISVFDTGPKISSN